MKSRDDSEKYFRTSSFALVNFLFTKGAQLAGVNDIGQGRKEFYFVNTGRVEELVGAFKFADSNDEELQVSARVYESTRRQLLDLLKGT